MQSKKMTPAPRVKRGRSDTIYCPSRFDPGSPVLIYLISNVIRGQMTHLSFRPDLWEPQMRRLIVLCNQSKNFFGCWRHFDRWPEPFALPILLRVIGSGPLVGDVQLTKRFIKLSLKLTPIVCPNRIWGRVYQQNLLKSGGDFKKTFAIEKLEPTTFSGSTIDPCDTQ
jgi:hypothetical protein